MNAGRNSLFRNQDNVKKAGFLEKKGKMKLVSQWKKYWFVLEERLLLYYRSETEYTNLSPCRGSLNMGLVSTVRPGSSSGPCVIHVITRTQVVQLRAKNRETQEEWLQALLHSMSLPLVSKTLKPATPRKSAIRYGSSLDNITFNDRPRPGDFENEWTLPRKVDLRKKQMSGTLYGGSLDTAIWSKKFRPMRTPSPSISKGKILERILGLSRDGESASALAARSKDSRLSLCTEEEMHYVGKSAEAEGLGEVKCRVHDENRNHDLYSVVDKKKKKKLNKTLSDTELNKAEKRHSCEELTKDERKDESRFERIRNALSRIPKEKIPKEEKGIKATKKRRQSFLQKVFKKRDCDSRDVESDVSDPLYDTIDHFQDQPRSLIPVAFRSGPEEEEKENAELQSLYAEVQKPVVGSKTILPETTMSELRMKLKSRESLENQEEKPAPSLPPRRVSRPISPWHDVPTNNAPVSGNKQPFFVHQAVVRFNDHIPKADSSFSDIEDDLRFDASEKVSPEAERKKNDDLSILLEQLTKITVAPLAEPELTDDNYNSSSESEKLWARSQLSDPDYDVPRPHRPLSILISEGQEIISATEFMGRGDHSDTSSSFRSMDPDSLETSEKKSPDSTP